MLVYTNKTKITFESQRNHNEKNRGPPCESGYSDK